MPVHPGPLRDIGTASAPRALRKPSRRPHPPAPAKATATRPWQDYKYVRCFARLLGRMISHCPEADLVSGAQL